MRLGLGQLFKRLGVADAGQVGVVLPAPHDGQNGRLTILLPGFEHSRPRLEVGLEPAPRRARSLILVASSGAGSSIPFPAAARAACASGVVPGLGPQVGGEFGFGGQRRIAKPYRDGIASLNVAKLSERKPLGGVFGRGFALEHSGQATGERQGILGVADQNGQLPAAGLPGGAILAA